VLGTDTDAWLSACIQLLAHNLQSEWKVSSIVSCFWPPVCDPVLARLVQIEHALAAVNQGTTSLGIKGAHSAASVAETLLIPAGIKRPTGSSSLQKRRRHLPWWTTR
jgi:hypothetical protein